jgi:hypothetical protein
MPSFRNKLREAVPFLSFDFGRSAAPVTAFVVNFIIDALKLNQAGEQIRTVHRLAKIKFAHSPGRISFSLVDGSLSTLRIRVNPHCG